jgi:hypothetical protein
MSGAQPGFALDAAYPANVFARRCGTVSFGISWTWLSSRRTHVSSSVTMKEDRIGSGEPSTYLRKRNSRSPGVAA